MHPTPPHEPGRWIRHQLASASKTLDEQKPKILPGSCCGPSHIVVASRERCYTIYVRLRLRPTYKAARNPESRERHSCSSARQLSIDMARRNAFLLLVLAQTTALKVFGTPGRGPAIQRVYPSDNSAVEYWLGAGQLTSCTVDDVRGLQKCVKVVSAAVYTDEEDSRPPPARRGVRLRRRRWVPSASWARPEPRRGRGLLRDGGGGQLPCRNEEAA